MSGALIRKGPLLAALAAALAVPQAAWAAADTWTQSNAAGFTAGANTPEAGRGASFLDPSDNTLYAYFGTQNSVFGGGVWRSSEGVSWNQVNNHGFGLNTSTSVVGVYTYYNGTSSAVFAGVANNAGGQLWRSLGGGQASSWRLVFSSVTTGGSQDPIAGTFALGFNNALYLGTRNNSGGEIWKSTSADWTGAWIQVATAGFGVGTAAPNVAYLAAFGGGLYAATNCPTAPCGQLWKSTGTVNPTDRDTWTQVLVASVTLDVAGNTSSISALESFGGFLYLTTHRATGGAQVWRSATPDTPASWTQVWSPDGDGATRFAAAAAREVRSLRAYKSLILYAGAWDATAGLVVYRSTDGVTFTRSNTAAGFGSAGNQLPTDFAFTNGRNGASVTAATRNDAAGSAVWRAPVQPPEPATLGDVHISSLSVSYTTQGTTSGGYQVDCSTLSDFGGTLLSSATPNAGLLALLPQGLTGNTTYYLRAGTIWSGTTGYAVLGSTLTRASAPAPSVTATTFNSISLAWTSTNGPTASYHVATSTAADPLQPAGAAISTTNVGTVLSYTTSSLVSNTVYAFRVAAINNLGAVTFYDQVLSTITRPGQPGLQGFNPVGVSSVNFAWTLGSNPAAGPALTWEAEVSTSTAFTTTLASYVSSATANLNVTFGTGGAGAALDGNTTYYFRARGVNASGPGPYDDSPTVRSTTTLAAVPGTAPFEIGLNFVKARWTNNTNSTGTLYQAILSTGASPGTNNFGGNVSTFTRNLEVVFGLGGQAPDLSPGATVFVQVKAINYQGFHSTFTELGSTRTLDVNVPDALAFNNITISTIQANWGANYNPGGTSYTSILSTGPSPSTNGFAGNIVATSFNLFAVYSPLAFNTTYYVDVKATNSNGADSAYRSLGSTWTLAEIPAAAALSGVGSSSITANWGANSNPAGTQFVAYLSTAAGAKGNGFAGNAQSPTTTYAAAFASLTPNTSYFLEVAAVNHGGIFTSTISLGSTATLAATPVSVTFDTAPANEVLVRWSANGNPSGTRYNVLTSTAADPSSPSGAVVTSSVTFNTYLSTAGLVPDTAYFFRVAGLNHASLSSAFTSVASTITLPAPAGQGSPAFSVGQGSITVNWTRGTNPAGGAALTYTALLSTGALPNSFASNQSSVTVSTAATFSSLSANVTYFFTLTAANATGSTTTAFGSTSTLAAAPSSLAATFSSTGVITVGWTSGGNGTGVHYRVLTSTAPDPASPGGAAATSSTTFSTSFSTAGLTGNATYYFRVAALNNNSVPSAYTAAIATFTLPAPPGAPAEPFSVVSSSSLVAGWTIGANSPTGAALTYTAVLSTGAFQNALAGNISVVTSSTGAAFGSGGTGSNLSGNTTYYAQVRASNSGGASDYASLGSTLTAAAVPTTLSFTASSSETITFAWDSAGNGSGVRYSVLASTADPSSAGGAVVTTSVTYNTSLSTAGLRTHTTYFFRVAAINNNGLVSAYSALASSFTAPAPPGAATPGFSNVQVASVTVNWTAGPNASTGPALRYLAVQSTGTFPNSFAGNVSSFTASLSATFGTGGEGAALTANTTYHYQVRAINAGGGGDFASIGSTSTLAQLSAGVAITSNAADAIQFSWGGAGNGPGASYTVLTSTAADPSSPAGAVVTTSVTFNTSLSTSGLVANTTYFFRISATNNNGVLAPFTTPVSTFTLPLPPAAGTPLFPIVGASSFTVSWTQGSNPPNGAALSYVAILSSAAFPNSHAGNVTVNTSSTGTLFGTGGAGSALTPSTTYYVRVHAVNAGGAGSYSALGATATLAASPVPAAFSAPSTSAIQFNWTSGGSGAGVVYTVRTSTAPDPSSPAGAVVTTSSTYNTSLSSSGLAANTTYWFRVAATNPNGETTAYTSAVGTATLANAPSALAFVAVEGSSVSLSWSAAANPSGTVYQALLSTAATPSAPAGASVTSSTTTSASVTFDGLGGNTTYYFQVAALSHNNILTSYTSALGTATLATIPVAAALSDVTNSSITANWGANGNRAGTAYLAQASTDSAFGVVNASSQTLNASALLTGLASGTTYFVRVRAQNVNGVPTPYAGLGSTVTLASPPSAPVTTGAAAGASSITWTWASVTNAIGYRVASTASVNVSGDLGASATTFTETSLSTNTAYARALAAFNGSGASTSTAVTRYTLAAPPTSVALGAVYVTSITLQWSANTNPAGTTFYAMAWAAGGSTTTVAVQLASAAITGLSFSTTYYLTVQAVNGDSLATASGVTLSTRTSDLPVSSATATPGAGATVVFTPPPGTITVVVPPGAFTGTVGVTVSTPSALTAAPIPGTVSQPTGVGVSITVTTGEQPLRAVAITVGFRDSDVAGLDRNTLALCRYDPTHDVWVPLLSSVDNANNTVTGLTDHLSIFQIMAIAPSVSVNEARVFPNPFRPALGHATITFASLPAGATLKVYSMLGEHLATFAANAAGLAGWDGRTRHGRSVASGLYLIHVESGGRSTVLRLGVQR